MFFHIIIILLLYLGLSLIADNLNSIGNSEATYKRAMTDHK